MNNIYPYIKSIKGYLISLVISDLFIIYFYFDPIFSGFAIHESFISSINYFLLILTFFTGIILELLFRNSKESLLFSMIFWPILTFILITLLTVVTGDMQYNYMYKISLLIFFIPLTLFYFLGVKSVEYIKGKK